MKEHRYKEALAIIEIIISNLDNVGRSVDESEKANILMSAYINGTIILNNFKGE